MRIFIGAAIALLCASPVAASAQDAPRDWLRVEPGEAGLDSACVDRNSIKVRDGLTHFEGTFCKLADAGKTDQMMAFAVDCQHDWRAAGEITLMVGGEMITTPVEPDTNFAALADQVCKAVAKR